MGSTHDPGHKEGRIPFGTTEWDAVKRFAEHFGERLDAAVASGGCRRPSGS
jgi:hypothetical protein